MSDKQDTTAKKKEEEKISVCDIMKSNTSEIIKKLDLLRPIYTPTSAYGHFGRSEPELNWEHTNKADIIREMAGLSGKNQVDTCN